MSPEAQQKAKRAAPSIAAGSSIVAIIGALWGTGILEAVAVRIQGGAPSEIAIMRAVNLADEHARVMLDKELGPLELELRKLTSQVDRMAGALEESNRRRNP